MELVNEWFSTGIFRNVDTLFWTNSSYEKELLADLPLTGYALQKGRNGIPWKILTYTWKDTTYCSYE